MIDRLAAPRQTLALADQNALVLKVPQQVLQPDPVPGLERERLGDVALAGAIGVWAM